MNGKLNEVKMNFNLQSTAVAKPVPRDKALARTSTKVCSAAFHINLTERAQDRQPSRKINLLPESISAGLETTFWDGQLDEQDSGPSRLG